MAKNNNGSSTISKFLLVLGFLTVAVVSATVGAVGGIRVYISLQQPSLTGEVGAALTQDPTLVADAQQLGIDVSPLNITFSTDPTSDTTAAGKTNAVFTPPNSIQIKSGLSKKDEINAVAYEYMHYVWSKLTEENKASLGIKYETFHSQNRQMQYWVSLLTTTEPELVHDEMNSIACAEIDPNALTEEFNNYCNTHIPNRAILFQM